MINCFSTQTSLFDRQIQTFREIFQKTFLKTFTLLRKVCIFVAVKKSVNVNE
nr:MAG TPA: hypothetical protein [Caudoviricetes sp.]